MLAKLGMEREDDGLGAGQPLPVLGSELPDWASVIAANLVIDGILTTFVASARESTIEPLAQRAPKILQEEGYHRVHAEAWLKRICRAGGQDRELLLRRIAEMWEPAARWPRGVDAADCRAVVVEGMVSEGPERLRGRVREWLISLLEAGGVRLPLSEPAPALAPQR